MDKNQDKQLEQLYREMYDLLLRYAEASLKNTSRAEEAVQETFRIACGKPDAVLGSENPEGWLVNTLKGVIRNFVRMDARKDKMFTRLDNREQTQGQEDGMYLAPELLYQDLAVTKEYQLMQAVSEGSSIRELAQRLGVTESACKKRVQRSRQVLRKKLSES